MRHNASSASLAVTNRGADTISPDRPACVAVTQRIRGLAIPLLVVVIAVTVDRVSKLLIEQHIQAHDPLLLLGEYVRLVLWYNDGAAFGIRLGDTWVHVVLSVLAMGLVGYMIWHTPREDRIGLMGFGLIMGGAVGNLWDRLAAGRVTDFIDVGINTYRWPTFNVADSCVVVGIGLLVVVYFLSSRRAHRDDDQPISGAPDGTGTAAGPGPDTA